MRVKHKLIAGLGALFALLVLMIGGAGGTEQSIREQPEPVVQHQAVGSNGCTTKGLYNKAKNRVLDGFNLEKVVLDPLGGGIQDVNEDGTSEEIYVKLSYTTKLNRQKSASAWINVRDCSLSYYMDSVDLD